MSIHLKKMLAGRSLPSRKAWTSADWKKLLFTLFLAIGIAPQLAAMDLIAPRLLSPDMTLNAEEAEILKERFAKMEPGKRRYVVAKLREQIECNKLIAAGVDINGLHADGNTLLMKYAQTCHKTICNYLLAHGARLDITNKYGETALMHAAQNDHEPICKLFVNHQSKINAAIKATLLCLNHLRQDETQNTKMRSCTALLYRQFNALLRPHMGHYFPVEKLLNMQNQYGKRAYDWAKYPCLKPAEIVEPGLLSNCSIQ